jgi:MFS family permease
MSVNCLSAIAAMPLLRFVGRRTLLLITFFTCTVSLILAAMMTNDAVVLSIMVIFIIMFELGPGPIGWLYMSEVMNEKGVAGGTFINWTFTLIFGLITTPLFEYFGQSTFFIFACTCGCGFFFVLFVVKETKGLS